MKLLFTEEKSISRDIAKLAKDIENCIIEDSQTMKSKYSTAYRRQFKTNTFMLSFQDDFPFLKDIKLTYIIYMANNEEEAETFEKMGVTLNSSYDDATNEMEITSYFIKGRPSLDFSESIIHEITHMYQYNKGMDKRRNLYDLVVDMASDKTNEYRRIVGLALYYTFPHEQDSFIHQFYTHSKDGEIETFQPYKALSDLTAIIKNNYKTNKFTQDAIHELGYTFKQYFKRLHFGLKRFERKLNNVKRYWFQELVNSTTKKRSIEHIIDESLNRTVIIDANNLYTAEISSEDCYNKFLTPRK